MPDTNTAPGIAEHIEQFAEHYLGKVTVEHDTEYGETIPADRVRAALENARMIGEALDVPTACWSHVPFLGDDGDEYWGPIEAADRDRLERALVYAVGELAALQREFNETAARAVSLIRLLDAENATTKENTMQDTTTRHYEISDEVVIRNHQDGANWIGNQAATVVAFDENGFCQTCHCKPADPDHQDDGSACCPGPWYVVEYPHTDCGQTHREVYAEHELSYPECRDIDCGLVEKKLVHVDH